MNILLDGIWWKFASRIYSCNNTVHNMQYFQSQVGSIKFLQNFLQMLVFFTNIKFIFTDFFVFSKKIINECHGQNIELNSVIKLLHIITQIMISSFSWEMAQF